MVRAAGFWLSTSADADDAGGAASRGAHGSRVRLESRLGKNELVLDVDEGTVVLLPPLFAFRAGD